MAEEVVDHAVAKHGEPVAVLLRPPPASRRGPRPSAAVTAAVLTGETIPNLTGVPALHAYVLCFMIVAVGAWFAAAVAVVHGIRHPAPARRIEALETS
jgi:hypothetical protein